MTGKFKAIVVGGGPTGLMMAHALARADIDWVLIERRDSVAFKTGATLYMLLQGVRILHQLGLMEEAEQIGSPLIRNIHTDSNGKVIRDIPMFEEMAKCHGYDGLLFDRQKYLRLLVETLPERETRVKTGKRVVGIDTTASGVVVKLDDGTVETGSIVIGADGIWSVVRQEMEKQLGEKVFDPEYCGFTGVYGHGDAVEGLETFNGYERHDGLDGMGLQVFTSPTKTFWGCYMRAEDESEEGRKFKRYSEEDAEAAIQKWLNVPVYGKVTFGDVWKARELWGMTQAHAGRAKLWHWDRIVLVGDAVHKVTPNIGAGAAVGSESAACLGNHLHALLQSQSQPDTESLSKAFAAYQAQRMEVSTAWVTIARTNLDSILWRNWWHRFKTFEMTNLLGPLRLQRLFSGPMIAKAVRLDYVPFDNEQTGTVPWRFGEVEEDPPRGIAYGWWFLGLGVLSAGALLWVQRSGLSIT